MDFKKKIKIRLYVALTYIIMGVLLMGVQIPVKSNDILSSFGLMLVIIGLARIKQYRYITKNSENFKQREIAETDERNIKIWTQARSLASAVYITAASMAIIVLYALDMPVYGSIISYNVMAFIVIYWICYFFTKRKF